MKNKLLLILILMISINSGFKAQVGINTESPSKTLDINGDVRVRNLPTSSSMTGKFILTIDASGNVKKINNTARAIGDVKNGLQTADHNGWYLMDGRNISALSTSARDNAVTIGITTTIPNMADRMIRTLTSGQTRGTLAGNNMVTITASNLPNYNLATITLASAGDHNHTWYDEYDFSTPGAGLQYGPYYNHGLTTRTVGTTADGNHAHTVTASTGGTSQPLNILPQYMVVNTFIYLGQ
ncbi:hypothetical protein SAMN05443633_104447 [Chryseobacterium arachidis]|uniref:Microcystin-dependent protein n=1 Tax=Chryseobacterium arachidis TaxID=1416778 RepID=A0A1M5C8L8_9FLAO|nr:hypothetical protein [Chryseobacterium arachidis]SHF51134.1 hypothetical protein SAMN05443633_104447 [Chryseobacterium arachidis]